MASRTRVRILLLGILGLALTLTVRGVQAQQAPSYRFSVSFSNAQSAEPLDGRLLLILSTDPSAEPRLQISNSVRTQILFGMDVDSLKPGQSATMDDAAFGYPIRYLHDVPAGDYFVQVVLHKYETFHRSDGHTVKLPMDRGEGQHWQLAPGNLYSKPRKITLRAGGPPVSIVLDQIIPPIPEPKDTPYIRHIKIQSDLLTKFWGRPMFLSANVLVPEGFDAHPGAHFPLMIFEDHFNDDFHGIRTTPPDPNLKPDYSERFHISGYNRIQEEEAYKFYQQWIAPDFPRFLVAQINHANPVLRRFLRREFREPGPLRRRHRNRIDSRDREKISRHRAGLGALRLRRFHRRMGIAGRAGILSGPLQRRVRRVPRSGGFPRLHQHQSLLG